MGEDQMKREKQLLDSSTDDEEVEEGPIARSQKHKPIQKVKPATSVSSKKKKKNDGLVQESQYMEEYTDSE